MQFGTMDSYSFITAFLLIAGAAFALTTVYAASLIIISAVRKPAPAPRPVGSYPAITAVIAAKNEALVLPSTIRRLLELPYPKDKFRIFIAVDEGDDATAASCEPFSGRVDVIVTKSRRGKPGVLNEILPLVETELLLLLDADSLLDRDSLQYLLPPIAEEGFIAASAQGYPLNEKEGIFPQFFKLECRIQAALNANKARAGYFAYTPGFGTLIKTSEVQRVSGWDETCLSEDSDLALRLWASGGRISASAAQVGMEAPAKLSVFFKQRLRWYRGMLDSYRKRWKLLLGIRSLAAIDVTIQFLSPALVALFLPFSLMALISGGVSLILLASILAIQIFGVLVIHGRFSWPERLLNACLIVPFLILNSAICIIVVATFVITMPLPWSRTEKSHYQVRGGPDQKKLGK